MFLVTTILPWSPRLWSSTSLLQGRSCPLQICWLRLPRCPVTTRKPHLLQIHDLHHHGPPPVQSPPGPPIIAIVMTFDYHASPLPRSLYQSHYKFVADATWSLPWMPLQSHCELVGI